MAKKKRGKRKKSTASAGAEQACPADTVDRLDRLRLDTAAALVSGNPKRKLQVQRELLDFIKESPRACDEQDREAARLVVVLAM